MSKPHNLHDRLIFSFGRRQGRRLPADGKRLVHELLPRIQIDEHTDIDSLFPDKARIWMEIGFGGGEHLAEMALKYPEVGFIGCEPFMPGVAKLLARIEQDNIDNIRIFTDDARLLCQQLADYSIDRIYVLFPDPWPKPRHHKRRLISHDTLALLARLQPKASTLQLATDHIDYAAWMLETLLLDEHYAWSAKQADDWRSPPEDWVETRYQTKTRSQGRDACFIRALRQ